MDRGLPEPRAVDSAFNGRGPWWNSSASHMYAAFGKSYFKSLKLVELKETKGLVLSEINN